MTNHARKFYVLLANHVKVYVYDADEVINVFRTGLVSSLLVLRFAPDAICGSFLFLHIPCFIQWSMIK